MTEKKEPYFLEVVMPLILGSGAVALTVYLSWLLFDALGERIVLLLPLGFFGYHAVAFYMWMRKRNWL